MNTLNDYLKAKPDAEWAAAIGATERAVSAWRYGTRRPSPDYAKALEAAGIPKYISRPDLWEKPTKAA
jgi:hypothetical protein